jgi:hypothetical protein
MRRSLALSNQEWLTNGSHLIVVAIASTLALVLVGSATAANPATLSINCAPKGTSPGTPASCIATVTDTGPVASRVPPAGSVTFTTSGAGTFDPGDTCSLEASGAFSSKCTVAYTPTAISGGSHSLLGTYNGDAGHGRATSTYALAVTPANDDLANAAPLPVPGTLTGTTEGATYADDDPELCSDAFAPVWYSLKPASGGRLAVRLTVRGRIDSVVAVYREDRSKLVDLGCDVSDVSGVAGVPFDVQRGATYLVAVAAPYDAQAGGFELQSVVVPSVSFPGVRLARDVDLRLDPLLHPSGAFSVRLRAGATFRINATAPNACVHVELLQRPPAAGIDVAKSDGCSGYLVYTPGPGAGGVFPLLVSLPEGRASSVNVAIRQAEADDLAPGVPLDYRTARAGRLSARDADVVDTYRFQVPARADATLALRGAVHADLLIFDGRGRQLACACDGLTHASIVEGLPVGSYLAVVRGRPAATGGYVLTFRLREPTGMAVRLTAPADAPARLALVAIVRPAAVGGRLALELDRFDPLSGWQFVATTSHVVAHGGTVFTLRPTLGAWRVRARYEGTLSTSPSVSNWINFSVDVATGGRGARGGSCAPGATGRFAVGGLILTCGGAGFGTKSPAPTTKTPAQQLRDLNAVVSGIGSLKDPFKSELLGDVQDAISALQGDNTDEARARLADFVATVQSAPLRAQLTADQRNRLVNTVNRIKAQIG